MASTAVGGAVSRLGWPRCHGHVPVWGLIRDRLPVTPTPGLTGLAIALSVALPVGILAAVREGSATDRAGWNDRKP
jgi:ABC-type dipeptide/oligopeptide/nickel transport system permease component